MLIIGLIILAAPVLSVYMDKAGTAMFFYSGKAHGDKDRKNRIVRCVLSMMIFGMISLTGYMNGCAMSKQERLAEELDGQQPGGIEGKVYEIRQSGDEWRVYVYAEWITFGGGDSEETVEYRGRSKVLLYMEDVGSLKTGMKLTLSCSLSRPDSADNPGEFDAREYYSHKGIYIVGKDISILECGEDYSRIGDILFRLRIKSGEITDSVFGETDGSVIKAMLLGDKSGIDRDTKKLFQMNGIAHILAISGVHIAIIGMTLFGVLRRLTGSYMASGIMAISVIVLYGVMTGMASSTVRAMIMMVISVIGQVKGRSPDMLTSAGTASVIQALIDPGIILDAGFQLSFAAVLGMAVPGALMKKLIPTKNKVVSTLVMNLAITLATGPLVIFYYYQFPLYSIFLNLLIVPLVSVIIFVSIVVIAAMLIFPGILQGNEMAVGIGAFPVKLILAIYRQLCEWAMKLPFYSINTGHVSVMMIVVFYMAMVGVLILLVRAKSADCARVRRRMVCLCAAVIITLCCVCYEAASFDREFRVVFMDVGQGDGILIRSGMGVNILIDGGSSSSNKVGEYVMAPVLKFYGAAHVDYAFVTHGDKDHVSGIQYLLSDTNSGIRIDNLVVPMYGDIENMGELLELAEKRGVNIIYMDGGSQMSCGKDVAKVWLNFLHPSEKTDIKDANDLSAVIRLEYRGYSVLFTGDLGEDGERELISEGGDLSADVLKVGHHGSRYSTSGEFLRAVDPDLAIISAGENNRYGHPHGETLERLDACGADVMSTIDHGAICVEITDGGISVTGYR